MNRVLVIIKPGFGDLKSAIQTELASYGYITKQEATIKLGKRQVNSIWADIKNAEGTDPRFPEGYFEEYKAYIISGNSECFVVENESTSDYSEVTEIKRHIRSEYHDRIDGFRDILHTSDSNELADKEIACLFTE